MMRIVTERRIGETRAAVYQAQTLKELHLRRDSAGEGAYAGDVFEGRVTSINKDLGAAFIDIGLPHAGFLRFNQSPNAPRLKDGDYVRVSVMREAEADKGPIVNFVASAKEKTIGKVEGASFEDHLSALYPNAPLETGECPDFMAAVEPSFAIPGGGVMTIEQTRALVAIDVDTDTAPHKGHVSIAAAKEAARQLRLRGLGGLVVIDFPNLRKRSDQVRTHEALLLGVQHDPGNVKVGPYSQFGTIELIRQRRGPSLMDQMLKSSGKPSAETVALESLNQLIKEGCMNAGAQLVLTVPHGSYHWLQNTDLNWREQVEAKIGSRFTVIPGQSHSVSADR